MHKSTLEHRDQMENTHADQLKTEGWTVVPNALTQDEIQHARSLFWDELESLGSDIKRSDLNTWSDENWPGNVHLGFMGSHGISQSKFAWFVRSRPLLREVFAKIWNTTPQNLICSMDCILCWRPWWLCDFEDWEVQTEGLHIDQNPNTKPGFHCVQGMVPLYDVTSVSGGLEVVSKTHEDAEQGKFGSFCPAFDRDWCPLPEGNEYIKERCVKQAGLILAKAGDLILWDSRLVHGGRVGLGPQKPATICASESGSTTTAELIRLSVPICMMPRDSAHPLVLERRRLAVRKGEAMNHWANEANVFTIGDSHGQNITKEPPSHELSESEAELV